MNARIQKVINEIKILNFSPTLFLATVEELKRDYPEFIYTEDMRGTTDIFHDLEKRVTPTGIKNSLYYEWHDLVPEMESELAFLLKVRNAIKKILCVVKAARNKKFILAVLEQMFNVSMSTGGGTSPGVRRVILMYEREGGILHKKRKNDIGFNLLDAEVETAQLLPAIKSDFFVDAEQAAKKVKGLDYPVDPVTEEDCQEVLSLFDVQPTDGALNFEELNFDAEADLFDDIFDVTLMTSFNY